MRLTHHNQVWLRCNALANGGSPSRVLVRIKSAGFFFLPQHPGLFPDLDLGSVASILPHSSPFSPEESAWVTVVLKHSRIHPYYSYRSTGILNFHNLDLEFGIWNLILLFLLMPPSSRSWPKVRFEKPPLSPETCPC